MSLYPSLQQSISSNSNKGGSSNSNTFFFARVNDILLSTETKTENFFNDAGGWAGLGSIKFTQIGTTVDNDKPSRLIAKPLFTNVLQYPILEEIVLILQAPSDGLNTDPQAKTYYYLTTVGLWNSIHHNAFPDIPNFNKKIKDKNNSSISQIEEGSSISNSPDTEVLKFGNSFKEKSDIRNLLPEEGDVIVEGRWGQSIRFSSTTTKKLPNNSWSSQGELGSPITIIRNGQTKENNNSAPWVPLYEDINNDGSSIYMSSGQDIPLELASKNLKSFDITVGAAFNSALQIPDPYIPSPDISPKQADNLKPSEPLYYVTESINVTSSIQPTLTSSSEPIIPTPVTEDVTQQPIASLRIISTDSPSLVGDNSSYFNILKNDGKYIVIRLETLKEFNPSGISLVEFSYLSSNQSLQYQGYGGKDTNFTTQIILMEGAKGTYIMKVTYVDADFNKIDLISNSFTQ